MSTDGKNPLAGVPREQSTLPGGKNQGAGNPSRRYGRTELVSQWLTASRSTASHPAVMLLSRQAVNSSAGSELKRRNSHRIADSESTRTGKQIPGHSLIQGV